MSSGQQGLQTNPIRMNSDALGALAADTALVLNSTFGSGLTQSFLIKQVLMMFAINGLTADESVIMGLANGSATVTEILAALTQNITNPDDASSPPVAAQRIIILWETLRVFTGVGGGGKATINEKISLGGGKGIPVKEATGMAIFAYNPSTGALTTGAVVNGLITLRGVWLND